MDRLLLFNIIAVMEYSLLFWTQWE